LRNNTDLHFYWKSIIPISTKNNISWC